MATYEPILEDGVFTDNHSLFQRNKSGERHICACRGVDSFKNMTEFNHHIQKKYHQNWILEMNKANRVRDQERIDIDRSRFEQSNPKTIREQQDDEYEETRRLDLIRLNQQQQLIEQQELDFAIQMSSQMEEEQKLIRKRASIREESGEYKFRFIFPNGHKMTRLFSKVDTIDYMKIVLDIYMLDAKMNIHRYELETNFPKKKYEGPHSIQSVGLENNSVLYIRNLDS